MKKHTLEPYSTETAYLDFLNNIKADIQAGRTNAFISANKELVLLYWKIGQQIDEQQKKHGWGSSVVEKLSRDLAELFPGNKSFSARNLWLMRQMYTEYHDAAQKLKQPASELEFLKQLVSEIPWGQNILIMQRARSLTERKYYLETVRKMGWSRNVLLNQMKADAYRHHTTEKKHNFGRALPAHLAEQADQAMKDVYMLDFLGIDKPLHERQLEVQIIQHIRDVLLAFGHGFAFIGNQYKVSTPTRDYYIDLLFFQRTLNCLVAVELKTGQFEAEYVGKMNQYLNLLDDFVRQKHENPSIGIILCAERDRIDVEYALRGINKPVGVSEYKLTKILPKVMKEALPEPELLEKELMATLKRKKSGK